MDEYIEIQNISGAAVTLYDAALEQVAPAWRRRLQLPHQLRNDGW